MVDSSRINVSGIVMSDRFMMNLSRCNSFFQLAIRTYHLENVHRKLLGGINDLAGRMPTLQENYLAIDNLAGSMPTLQENYIL
ncbi:MAG: hypothetical protein WBV73_14555 [Phormidium sp.]